MKRYILLLIVLTVCYPFLSGSKGCGGSSQFLEVDQIPAGGATNVGADEVTSGNRGVDTTIQGEGEDAGKADFICNPGEDVEKPDIPCLKYFPANFSLGAMFNIPNLLANQDQLKNIGALKDILNQIGKLEAFLLGMSTQVTTGMMMSAQVDNDKLMEFAEKLSSICFACVADSVSGSNAQSAGESDYIASNTVSSSLNTSVHDSSAEFNISMCKGGIVIVNVFKEAASLAELVQDGIVSGDVKQVSADVFKFSDVFVGMQAAVNVIVIADSRLAESMQSAAGLAGNISPAEANLFKLATPSSIAMVADIAGMRLFASDPLYRYVGALFKVDIKALNEARALSFLNFGGKYVSMSAAIHDIEKKNADEDPLVMEAFLRMPYMDFLSMLEQVKPAQISGSMQMSNAQPFARDDVDQYTDQLTDFQKELRIVEQDIANQKAYIADLEKDPNNIDQTKLAEAKKKLESLQARATYLKDKIDNANVAK